MTHGVVVVHCADSNVNICSGICPVRADGQRGAVGHAGQRHRRRRAAAHVQGHHHVHPRTSKARRVTDQRHPEFLTVAEGYYLGTTSGHKYFGAGEGFAVGDKLHAVVIDDGDFPEAAHPP